ncbi:MAG: gephyrin-like molybdotransferase Glp [Methanobrevibacter boviskoreani]|jgi:molybdopterin molybdotransferase|uniref:molybdenum cofactor synthesis domain-containing protein n=1 Tax=Methanobrevibacter boviskoreani TaxID=1348249 RepID=UPI000593EB79|nr:gephyrin-like molybdotransferase Glp [Methanobrevibacter boviskoreani]MDD6256131.1 molybdopterin-binding protein [Methanobrevibacter boviskoreani]
MGTEFLNIKDSVDAKNLIQEYFNKYYEPEGEEIPIENSNGRVVFEDIYAKIDFPPFDRALKDGFAIKSEDSFGASEENPKVLKVIDALEAGSYSKKTVENGLAVEISTGSPLPEGADSVLMFEYSLKNGDEVELYTSVTPTQDVGKKGSDVKDGNLLIKKDTVLSASKIGVLAAQGFTTVKVYKKPNISIISTGNELTELGEELKPSKIYDVNSYMIKNAVESIGANGTIKGIVKDDYDQLKSKILECLEEYDILICSGGTSAGVGDVLKHVLDEIGEVKLHGIAVQPGKPTILGVIGEKLVIGLPGNPVSSLVIFNVFVAPAIRSLLGLKESSLKKVEGKLTKRIHSAIGREQYQLVKYDEGKVEPIFKDSGAIFSLARADGYVNVSKNTELVEEGEIVEVNLFN